MTVVLDDGFLDLLSTIVMRWVQIWVRQVIVASVVLGGVAPVTLWHHHDHDPPRAAEGFHTTSQEETCDHARQQRCILCQFAAEPRIATYTAPTFVSLLSEITRPSQPQPLLGRIGLDAARARAPPITA